MLHPGSALGKSPSSPSWPYIYNLVLAPLVPAINNQIPIVSGTRNAAVIRPHTNPLPVAKRHFVFLVAFPHQDTVLLADAPDLPTAVHPWEFWARCRGVEAAPGHQEPPAGVVLPWDLALICHGLATKGEGAGVDQGFGCAVGAAVGVDCLWVSEDLFDT